MLKSLVKIRLEYKLCKVLKIKMRQTEKYGKMRKGYKMIKGVNRQVIEISETDCEYFERVMFFVKPEFVNVSEGKLRERANVIAGKNDRPPMMKIVRNRIWTAVSLLAAAGAGAGVTALVTAALR